MPDPFSQQGEPREPRRQASTAGYGRRRITEYLIRILGFVVLVITLPITAAAQNGSDTPLTAGNPFDIAVIIDNRPDAESAAARGDIDALLKMFDQHMFIDQVMILERPTHEVVCDVFGCPEPEEASNPFPPLIWQITREDAARLLVYYIGAGRIEGRERQLLFRRTDDSSESDVLPFDVSWLHGMLEDAEPGAAFVLLDTSFTPKPLPCANEDPLLISDALLGVRRIFETVMRDQRIPSGHVELGATTPVQPSHCDRFDQTLNAVERPLFTKFLLKGIIEGEADHEPFGDQDRLIDLGEITAYLDDRIKHAARFQWGRLQNVRAAGPGSRMLAAVDRRDLRVANDEVIKRRNRKIETVDTGPNGSEADPKTSPEPENSPENEKTGTDGGKDKAGGPDAGGDTKDKVTAKGDTGKGDTGASDGNVVATVGGGAAPPPEERSTACRWIAGNVSPFAITLMTTIGGDTAPSCIWAMDRSKVELGPIAKIITPVAWRLGRTTTQDAVSCLLDCDNPALPAPQGTPTTSEKGRGEGEEKTVEGTKQESIQQVNDGPAEKSDGSAEKEEVLVDPPFTTAFNLEICDRLHKPLPPYIGLPRWMPGTLIISELLRNDLGCPPPPTEPLLPVPLIIAIETPPKEDEQPPASPSPDTEKAVADADRKLGAQQSLGATTDPSSSGGGEKPADVRTGVQIADSTPPVTSSEPSGGTATEPEPGDDFELSVSQGRWLQSALMVDNRNPGPIDGVVGDKTMDAVRSWRLDHNSNIAENARLTEDEFRRIVEAFGRRFEQVQAIAPSF